MSALPFVAWLHLVLGVLVTGLALFWAIMGAALGRAHQPAETDRLLAVTAGARWPHVVVPWKLRLTLPWTSACVLLATSLTGLLLAGGLGGVLALKIVLSLGLLGAFVGLARRPTPVLGYAALGLALAVMALSTLLGR